MLHALVCKHIDDPQGEARRHSEGVTLESYEYRSEASGKGRVRKGLGRTEEVEGSQRRAALIACEHELHVVLIFAETFHRHN